MDRRGQTQNGLRCQRGQWEEGPSRHAVCCPLGQDCSSPWPQLSQDLPDLSWYGVTSPFESC